MTDTFGLTGEQLDLLMRPLSPTRVREHKGSAHLEAWDVRRWLTRIFGFGGWSDQILECTLVHESVWPVTDGSGKPVPGKNRATVVYRVTLRLTVKDVHGRVVNAWDDAATGEGVNQASVGDAHDLALKAAVSQALKRCAVNLGDQFGLSLYNDGGLAPVVVRTLGHPATGAPTAEHAEDAPVVGGELDEQQPEPPVRNFSGSAEVFAGAGNNPSDQAPDVPMITDGQRKAVFAMLTRKHGKVTDEQRYQGLSKFAGREITSLNEYTAEEATRLLAALDQQPDHTPPKPAPAQTSDESTANFREAEQLLKLEQGQEHERLEDDLRDAIESSDNPNELAAAMSMAAGLRDEGRITTEQHTRLAAAADERAARARRQYAAATA